MKEHLVVPSAFICCFVLLEACTGCAFERTVSKEHSRPDKVLQQTGTPAIRDDADAPPDELIVWRKPGRSAQQVEDWIRKLEDSGKVKEKQVVFKRNCGSCDQNALVLLRGPGVKNYIQGDPSRGIVKTSVSAPTTGEDEPVYLSRNFRVRRNRSEKPVAFSVVPLPSVPLSGKPVRVAVMDTGIEPGEADSYLYQSAQPSCIPGITAGLNVLKLNDRYRDDDPLKHGTTVTRFILDQVQKYRQNAVEIIPIKTHDEHGESDLFSVLCAFAYAKDRGAQIINCSFGFYTPLHKLSPEEAPNDPNVVLLRKYVRHFLTDNHILLVTAAGNYDKEYLVKTFEEHGSPYRPENLRDLGQVGFYPASLARNPDFPNVIAVTTVGTENGEGQVSPGQNFSAEVVDLGVQADKVIKGAYVFRNPRLSGTVPVEGSSFAAPVVTGVLCANYDKIRPILYSSNFKKEHIWATLGQSVVTSRAELKDEIRWGLVMKNSDSQTCFHVLTPALVLYQVRFIAAITAT